MAWHKTTIVGGNILREVELDDSPEAEDWDDYTKSTTRRCRCTCCNECRFFTDGPRRGTCFCGGPYLGYVFLQETG